MNVDFLKMYTVFFRNYLNTSKQRLPNTHRGYHTFTKNTEIFPYFVQTDCTNGVKKKMNFQPEYSIDEQNSIEQNFQRLKGNFKSEICIYIHFHYIICRL